LIHFYKRFIYKMAEPELSEYSEEGLGVVFDKALALHDQVEESSEPSASQEFQNKVKKCIMMLEDCTRLVSLINIFSRNENYKEVVTEHLRYFMLPVLLGDMNSRLTGTERAEIVEASQIYYIDFLQRVHDYEFAELKIPELKSVKVDEGGSAEGSGPPPPGRPGQPDLAQMNRERANRMLRKIVMLAFLGAASAFAPAGPSFMPRLRNDRCAASPTILMANPISSNDFKNGVTLKIDGNIYKVVEFLHVKPGKGSAFVRTKLKNMSSGGNLEKTFRAGEMVDGADVFKYDMQFNYMDGDDWVFMDMESFDTETIPPKVIGDNSKWIKEGTDIKIVKAEGKIIDIEIPMTMTLEVTQTDPGEKGNTAQGASKPATLETGATINVPLFIKTGEKVRVDTADGKYLGRDTESKK
jgi:elongation factor P